LNFADILLPAFGLPVADQDLDFVRLVAQEPGETIAETRGLPRQTRDDRGIFPGVEFNQLQPL
jgi:hypothetical protein